MSNNLVSWIVDERLSLQAKGVLAIILNFNGGRCNKDFISEKCSNGVESVMTAMNELYKSGYLERRIIRDCGRIVRYEYHARDTRSNSAPLCYENVYLLKFSDGLSKIGYSRNLKSRIRSISREYAKPVEIYSCNANRRFESELHARYDKQNIGGEYFKLSDSEFNECISLMKQKDKK